MSRKWLALLLPVLALLLTLSVALAAGSISHVAAAAPAGEPAIAAFFSPSVRAWESKIRGWAAGYGLDPNLAATVMQIESCGNPEAVSRAGAVGLFQVMPFHFEAGELMADPDTNARRGLEYLAAALLESGGDIPSALAGYNAGLSVVHAPRESWPAETRRYAYWGSGIYADSISGSAVSNRLDEWLQAGGDSLCRRAAA